MIVTATLADALRAAANFIENVSDDTPDRTDQFFKTREAWRNALTQYDEAVAEREVYAGTIESARNTYCNDEINIDDDAMVSVGDDGVWVEAWVWVQNPEDDED